MLHERNTGELIQRLIPIKCMNVCKETHKNFRLNHQKITRIRSQIIVWFVSAQHTLIVLFGTGKTLVIIPGSTMKIGGKK